MTTENLPAVLQADHTVLFISQYSAQLMDAANLFAVRDESSAQLAINAIADISNRKRQLEERRKEQVSPVQTLVKQLNDAFRSIAECLDTAAETYKTKLKMWNDARTEEARLAHQQAQAHITEIAKAAGMSVSVDGQPVQATLQLPPQSAPSIKMKTGQALSYERSTWHFEIVDPDVVPREYCSPDSKKIRAAILTWDKREIPGVKIYLETDIQVRKR